MHASWLAAVGEGGTVYDVRRIVAVVALSLVPVIAEPTAARAAHQPGASIALNRSAGPPTTKVVVTGAGFIPLKPVVIKFAGVRLGGTTADSGGAFAKPIRVPRHARPGTHTVEAVGGVSGSIAPPRSLFAPIGPSSDSACTTLAITGSRT